MRTGRRLFFLLALAGCVLSLRRSASGQATDWKQIVAPPLHAFHPQMPRRIALPNGMVIFLQEDHELPLIRGTAQIRGGSREVAADKVGLVDIYGQVWRTGGTRTRTGDQLDDFLEAHAAKVETGGGLDSTTISWDCLKDNFEDVFAVFVELLRQSEFREEKIPLAKDQLNTRIARRNDNVFEVAGREAAKLAYGANSPYARQSEYATVATVTRDDLVKWHQATVHPNNIILGVMGDFDSKAMETKLNQAFASWPKGPAVKKVEVSFREPEAGLYFIQKDDLTSSAIRMVALGTRRDNPDYFAIEVLNEAFGGGFSSRLFSNIRSKKGLAYYVYGGIRAEFDHPGQLQLGMGTKNSTTAASVDALREELDALEKNPITTDELKKAKDSILNSFVFRFDSKEKVLHERMSYEFYGYPADFLERYRAAIEKVTQDDVARVAHRYIHKDRFAILVVGKAGDFDRPLSSFGPVTTIDITIPPPPGAKPAAAVSSGSNAEGKALLAKVIEGMGGVSKVQSVKSLHVKVKAQMNTPQGEMAMEVEEFVVLPDRSWQKMTTPMGDFTMVTSPAASFMAGAMGNRDMPASQKDEMAKEMRSEPLFVAQHADDSKYIFSAGASEKVGDLETKILDVNADGVAVRWFVDPATGRIVRTSGQAMGMSGPGERVTDYSDWKTAEGISLPFKESRTLGGQKEATIEVDTLEFNSVVDPKLFEKPSAADAKKQ